MNLNWLHIKGGFYQAVLLAGECRSDPNDMAGDD
jgi:hypothetical protein